VGESASELAEERECPRAFRVPGGGRQEMTVPQQLLELLVCPKCRGELEYKRDEALVCHHCRLEYPVRDGIPIMLIDEAKPLR
jgi:uncharacterized protein YbaR (Trm112 family)